jgi:hypothetical protein
MERKKRADEKQGERKIGRKLINGRHSKGEKAINIR